MGYTVADEIKALGSDALPFQLDMRDAAKCEECVKATVEKFGRVDTLINNASALWWHDIVDSPINKYDLITQINSRGTFAMTRACLPHMAKNGWGHVITMSPPISLDRMAGYTAYNISKFGMTLVALGTAAEYKGKGVAGNSLWPVTVVESSASENFKLLDRKNWRKASVIADATLSIISEDPKVFTGNQLYDEEYLRSKGVTDFTKYRCDPNHEPPAILGRRPVPPAEGGTLRGKRGLVAEVASSKL
eukprot:NODE_549_length_921_cov_440.792431_g358_i0.p1 GENE.NODE_549_length_921_cov_440.792431_g358_i0~~NODE_549_length_921_cov_440.792431_g358_i0.p1  ORF type:complete len:256 (+),score=110.33 NODE_549_length_921_cov_440.792431_g358_i0:26-769(+)